jgi:hypothetical protein
MRYIQPKIQTTASAIAVIQTSEIEKFGVPMDSNPGYPNATGTAYEADE